MAALTCHTVDDGLMLECCAAFGVARIIRYENTSCRSD